MNNSIEYKKQCLKRHYEGMTKQRAVNVMDNLNKKEKQVFIKRVNYAKGWEFIRA